jgi:hypothetical protein
MMVSRKISALFFALLVIFFSGTYYSTAHNLLKECGFEGSEGIFFISAADQTVNFFLHQKSSPSSYQGWKTDVRVSGLWALNTLFCESPQRKVIRKILVINSISYTPCKSVIIFPFHEFL